MGLIAQQVYEIDERLYHSIRSTIGADTLDFERMYESYCSDGAHGLKRFFVIEEGVEFELFEQLKRVLNDIKNKQLTEHFTRVVNNENS